jgi:poly(A) polymerase
MEALAGDGSPARFVGGCVRDALVDPTADTTDLDIATPELPDRVMTLLSAAGIRAWPTGLRHGTVSADRDGRHFEITTLRRDVACFGRHAEVAFTRDFDEDAGRRDFTVNAMSCEADGTLHDPLGGRADLAAGRVRFVGDPRQRIVEDYLRILRFFRFYARYGRGAPDAAGVAACRDLASGIDELSGERVRQELWRILAGRRPAEVLGLMETADVLARIVPGPVALPVLDRLVDAVAVADPLLRLAALIRPSAPERVDALGDRLRLANDERARLHALVGTPLPDLGAGSRAQRLAIHRLGAGLYGDLVLTAQAEGRIGAAEASRLRLLAGTWRVPDFPLTGDDIVALGVEPGPWLGRILAQVRHEWEEADFTLDRPACLTRASQLAPAARRDLTP